MTEIINLQIYGVPIVMYGLVGITTGVLAYATYVSEAGDVIAKSLTDLTENSMTSLSNINSVTNEKSELDVNSIVPELGIMNNESKDDSPSESKNEMSIANLTSSSEPEPEKKTGGRKRRKSPRIKNTKLKTRKQKSKNKIVNNLKASR